MTLINPRSAVLGACTTAAVTYAASIVALRVRRCQRAQPLVAFASGGAGCHVFPALAVAGELRSHGVEAAFLGESRGLEVHVVPQYGMALYCISSVDIQRPIKSVRNALKVLRFPLCVAHSACALVRAAPDVVMGMGGRVSVPTCVAAVALGIPLLLYEPNAQAGSVTRALHVIAHRTLLAHESAAAGMRFKDRCSLVGSAVRQEVLGCAACGPAAGRERRRSARQQLGVVARGSRLLVVLGAARGCGYLNCAVNNALPQLAALPGLHVLWQTGAKQYVAYSAGYAASLPSVRCVPFIQDMGATLAAADLVLCRAGASTVAELHATGTPAVLVPSPAVSEEQQTANARLLADKGMAELLPQVEVDEHGLAPRLLPLLAPDSRRLLSMRAKAAAAAVHDRAAVGGDGPAAAASVGARGDCRCRSGEGVTRIRRVIMQHIRRR